MASGEADLAQSKLDLAEAQRGIRSPSITTLLAGVELFRFASTVKPSSGSGIASADWAKSPWWFLDTDYHKILARYKAGSLGLGTVARSAAAVQPSWSRMDISIKARLRFDKQVYIGKGKTQYRDLLPNGMYMTLTGWPDINQIFIPGLREGYHHALTIVRQKVITTDPFGF